MEDTKHLNAIILSEIKNQVAPNRKCPQVRLQIIAALADAGEIRQDLESFQDLPRCPSRDIRVIAGDMPPDVVQDPQSPDQKDDIFSSPLRLAFIFQCFTPSLFHILEQARKCRVGKIPVVTGPNLLNPNLGRFPDRVIRECFDFIAFAIGLDQRTHIRADVRIKALPHLRFQMGANRVGKIDCYGCHAIILQHFDPRELQ